MNLNRLMVTYGGTINTGDYSNVKIEVSVEATLDEGDNPHGAKDVLLAQARAAYISEVVELAERNHTAFNYLRTLDPATADALTEKRRAAAVLKAKDGK